LNSWGSSDHPTSASQVAETTDACHLANNDFLIFNRESKNIYSFLFFFAILGLELRTYTLSYSTSPFIDDFFEIGPCKLSARQFVFKPQSY
jgi:hypothetical protein